MNRILIIINTVITLFVITSCHNKQTDNSSAESKKDRIVSNAETADSLKKTTEVTSVASNGQVTATRFTDVSFQMSLPIKKVCVKNGDYVKAGQPLVILDTYELENNILVSQKTVESARLEMQDVIISQGYDPKGTVPEKVKKLAEIKSGYSIKQSQLDGAKYALTKGIVNAPFSGMIANMNLKAGALSQTGALVCRIIDNSTMVVEFKVMEQELSKVRKGSFIQAAPFSDNNTIYEGVVTEINPIVDNDGCVLVKAKIGGSKKLFDGMHVKVLVK